eukprot:15254408-Alexandrium_andersonii.AAC.1
MSASLVGSEMCIRDRPRGVGRPKALADTTSGAARPPECGPLARSPARACLLYTSDAADDM